MGCGQSSRYPEQNLLTTDWVKSQVEAGTYTLVWCIRGSIVRSQTRSAEVADDPSTESKQTISNSAADWGGAQLLESAAANNVLIRDGDNELSGKWLK